jgi:hypothetical protein
MPDKVPKTADAFPIEVAPTVADRYKLLDVYYLVVTDSSFRRLVTL